MNGLIRYRKLISNDTGTGAEKNVAFFYYNIFVVLLVRNRSFLKRFSYYPAGCIIRMVFKNKITDLEALLYLSHKLSLKEIKSA